MKVCQISVIIPVYNAQQHLRQCLDSVLNQSPVELEVICVDDGSGDGSLKILREYEQIDSRVRVLTQKNQYAGVARNHGMKHARGKYLAFLDADDFFLPGALEAVYQEAERHEADMVKGCFCCLDTETTECYTTPYSRNCGVAKHKTVTFSRYPERFLNLPDVPWNGLYRREFLEQNGIGFNALRCVNDHSFYIYCLLKARRICVTDQMMACYRVSQSGSLIGKKAAYFENQIASYEIVKELCRGLSPELSRKILRQELNGMFGWYGQLKKQPSDRMEQQLHVFLGTYEENDVGETFLREFPYREEYYRLRYGTAAPGKRRAFLIRMLRCWQEHGWTYTFGRILHKELKEKYDIHSVY